MLFKIFFFFFLHVQSCHSQGWNDVCNTLTKICYLWPGNGAFNTLADFFTIPSLVGPGWQLLIHPYEGTCLYPDCYSAVPGKALTLSVPTTVIIMVPNISIGSMDITVTSLQATGIGCVIFQIEAINVQLFSLNFKMPKFCQIRNQDYSQYVPVIYLQGGQVNLASLSSNVAPTVLVSPASALSLISSKITANLSTDMTKPQFYSLVILCLQYAASLNIDGPAFLLGNGSLGSLFSASLFYQGLIMKLPNCGPTQIVQSSCSSSQSLIILIGFLVGGLGLGLFILCLTLVHRGTQMINNSVMTATVAHGETIN